MPLGNGDPIALWENQVSGSTVDGVQSNPSFRPTVDTTVTLNGYPSIKFVGGFTGQSFAFDNLFAGTTGATGATVFLVVQKKFATGDGNLWSFGGNVGSPTWYGDPDGVIKDGALTQPRKITADPAQDLTQPHIYAVRSKDGDWSNWINGVKLYETSSNTYVPGAGGGGGALLGINSTGDGFSGWVWMLGMTARWLTDAEMAVVFNAIAARYAMTLP
jgi:hypothetical protein